MAPTASLSARSLAALPAALADRWPAQDAVIARRGRLTFAALYECAGAIASGLAARGVGPGTKVALLAPNCPEWLAIAFAVWRCGAVLVPISTLYRPRELQHALSLADVEVLIAVRQFLKHDYQAMVRQTAPAVRAVV